MNPEKANKYNSLSKTSFFHLWLLNLRLIFGTVLWDLFTLWKHPLFLKQNIAINKNMEEYHWSHLLIQQKSREHVICHALNKELWTYKDEQDMTPALMKNSALKRKPGSLVH